MPPQEIPTAYLPLSKEALENISTMFTPEGAALLAQEYSPFTEAVVQVAGFMALHDTYADVRAEKIRAAGHPIREILKVPNDSLAGPHGNSFVYARDGGLIIKASMPGYSDEASFRDMQHIRSALTSYGDRVSAPAQLALLRSKQTGQTSLIMEQVPGIDLNAYTHGLTGQFSPLDAVDAYDTGVHIVKKALVGAIGRSATFRLDDLAVRKQASNILTTGDPRRPETQLYVIDQRFSSLASAALAPLRRIGRR